MNIAYSEFKVFLLRALGVRAPLTNLKVYVCKISVQISGQMKLWDEICVMSIVYKRAMEAGVIRFHSRLSTFKA